MAELVLSLRDRELSRTPVTHAKLIVGRDATCDVVIDNAGVSRNHAVLLYMNDEFRVRDMDSQNGITVNGKPVKDCVLRYGDVIGIGKFEMKLLETFEEITIEAGAKSRVTAPRNVMGTMQMSAVAVAGLRDQIAAKQAGRKVEPATNGAAGAPKARAGGASPSAQARDHKKTPAAKPRERIVPPSERAPQPERAARPERAAQPERAAALEPQISAPPPPPTNAMLKPLAIGVAVLAVLVIAALILL
jgi:pSer/pThr/pTyr-binding forkhead associated (FHA) protein